MKSWEGNVGWGKKKEKLKIAKIDLKKILNVFYQVLPFPDVVPELFPKYDSWNAS